MSELRKKPIIQLNVHEFEKNLFDISHEAQQVVDELYEQAKAKGNVDDWGRLIDSCCVGSTVMYLDGRSKLFKLFCNWPYDPNSFYFISVYGNTVHISLRSISNPFSYTCTYAAHEVVVKRLREIYSWEIYNDVKVD